jgi:hypothetical protein
VNTQARLRIGWTLFRTLSSRKWLLVHVCLLFSNFTELLAYLRAVSGILRALLTTCHLLQVFARCWPFLDRGHFPRG